MFTEGNLFKNANFFIAEAWSISPLIDNTELKPENFA